MLKAAACALQRQRDVFTSLCRYQKFDRYGGDSTTKTAGSHRRVGGAVAVGVFIDLHNGDLSEGSIDPEGAYLLIAE